jgi:hypothetical protein
VGRIDARWMVAAVQHAQANPGGGPRGTAPAAN